MNSLRTLLSTNLVITKHIINLDTLTGTIQYKDPKNGPHPSSYII